MPLDQLTRLVVQHRQGQEFGARIALRAADVEQRWHIDQLEVGKSAVHWLESGIVVEALEAVDFARLVHPPDLHGSIDAFSLFFS